MSRSSNHASSAAHWSVAVLLGSLRTDSYSERLALALDRAAPTDLRLGMVDTASLPLYNADLEIRLPTAWQEFRQRIASAHAVLFVTPEYNRSIPGGLKNAIDVGSRPYGESVFSGKPAAVVSQSPGAMGGFGANHALRQSLVFLDMPTMAQPELYLGTAGGVLGAGGRVSDEGASNLLRVFMQAFSRWIERHVQS